MLFAASSEKSKSSYLPQIFSSSKALPALMEYSLASFDISPSYCMTWLNIEKL